MTPPTVGTSARCRASLLARPALRVMSWQPLVYVMVAGILIVASGNRAGVHLRLSIAGAAVAAATAFLLDDSAAVTLAASPTSLSLRRLQRVTVAALAVGLWWAAAIAVTTHLVGGFPLRGRALELSVFVAVATAVSATASTMGDRTAGGIAGALFSMAGFATTFLPSRTWLPLPPNPDAPGATSRLLAVLFCAIAVLAWVSRDPARRRLLLRTTGARNCHPERYPIMKGSKTLDRT